MVLTIAVKTIHRYYGLSMEDFVGIGNLMLVKYFDHFDPDKGVRFSSYMKKVIVRSEYASVKSHITWERDEDVDPDSVGIVRGNAGGYLEQRMERALMTLSKDELRIIRMLFTLPTVSIMQQQHEVFVEQNEVCAKRWKASMKNFVRS